MVLILNINKKRGLIIQASFLVCKYHIIFAPKYRRKEKRNRKNTENVM
ncbi:hypothetical protein ND00_24500 [Clostridium sp. L74]|nr:hypothetical protein ND00_24500 [Clostridium sp. L74]